MSSEDDDPDEPRPTEYRYEIHLVSDITGEDLRTPITSSHLHYYDSGVWVRREHGRDFVPYEHVRYIRERPVDSESAPESTPDANGE